MDCLCSTILFVIQKGVSDLPHSVNLPLQLNFPCTTILDHLQNLISFFSYVPPELSLNQNCWLNKFEINFHSFNSKFKLIDIQSHHSIIVLQSSQIRMEFKSNLWIYRSYFMSHWFTIFYIRNEKPPLYCIAYILINFFITFYVIDE